MAIRLFIKPMASGRPRYQIWIDRNGVQQEFRFAGFSYYGEVSGLLDPPSSNFVELTPDHDPPNENWEAALSHPNNTTVVMTYGQWMAFLADHRVNQSRLFCFPEVFCDDYPILRVVGGKYNLRRPGDPFLGRLTRYLELARRKGIVVQISFASVQMLRNDSNNPGDWKANPFNAANNVNGFINAPNGVGAFCKLGATLGLEEAEKLYIDAVVNAAKPVLERDVRAFQRAEREPRRGGGRQLVHRRCRLGRREDPRSADGRSLAPRHDECARRPAVEHPHRRQPAGAAAPRCRRQRPPVAARRRLPVPRQSMGRRQRRPRLFAAAAGGIPGGDDRHGHAGGDRRLLQPRHRPRGRHHVSEAPVAVICDSDAHDRAQDHPEVYAPVCFNNDVSYIHRWSGCYLTQGKVKAQIEALQSAIPAQLAPVPDTSAGPAPFVPS